MIVVWIVMLLLGVAGAAGASRWAVGHAIAIADRLGVSRGLVGVTLVAIGTDLPEIANSISASLSGHGDLNVGDSTGSALTQVTLVLALLLFASPANPLAGRMVRRASADGERDVVVPVGLMTVFATLIIVILVSDGLLSRLDGLILVLIWAVSMVAVSRMQRQEDPVVERIDVGTSRRAALLIGWLLVVAVSATAVVRSFVELTEIIGVPELIASTIVLALGTSLPELVVDWTAIRRGASALALGNLFGSSLFDATLSIGIGPTVRPTDISSDAVWSVLIVAAGVAAATWIARPASRAGRRASAASLLAVYVACTIGMLAVAAI